ncbi:MAG: PAS domain S-box protein, partial [Spartobacteria bacterium]|nr:PAS domain S-box protein [Spartobacteria bacterium]
MRYESRDECMKSQSAKRAWLTTMVHVVVPVSLTALLFVISIFFILLPYLERYLMDSRRHMIQELTTTVWVLIENYNDRVLSGELSLEEAQNRAKARIRSLRYGKEGKDYFWINDLNHHMVMHPYLPELEGSSLYDYADPDGTYLVRNFVETVKRKDAGFVGYKWQWKDDPKRIVPKESFVKLFEPWGWIIGTGVYLDDVHREIHAITARLVRTLVGILLLVGLLSAYSIWDGRKRELARAAADEALRNSEERFRQLANASWEAIAIHDNGVLLLANDQFFDMFGYMQPELLGSQILDKIIAPQSRLMAQKQINQFQPGPIEFVGLKRNGDTFPLEARSRRLDFRGRKAQVAVLRDISERKKMEEVMLHSEKMISVGGLAAGLAH